MTTKHVVQSIVPILAPTERSFGRATENLILRGSVEEKRRLETERKAKEIYYSTQCRQLVLEDLSGYTKRHIYGLHRDGYLYSLARFLEVYFSINAELFPGLIPTRPKGVLFIGQKNVGKSTFIKKFFAMNSPESGYERFVEADIKEEKKNLGVTSFRNLYWLKWKQFRGPDGNWSITLLNDFFACVQRMIKTKEYTVIVIDDLDKHIDDPLFKPYVNKFLKMYESDAIIDANNVTLLASIRPENLGILDDFKLFGEYQFTIDYPDATSLTDYYFEELRRRIRLSLIRLLKTYWNLFLSTSRYGPDLQKYNTLNLLLSGLSDFDPEKEQDTTFLDAIEEGIPTYAQVHALIVKKKRKDPNLTFSDVAGIIEKQSYENILDFFRTQSFQKITTTYNGRVVTIPVTLFGTINDFSNVAYANDQVVSSDISPPSLNKLHLPRSKDSYLSDTPVAIRAKNAIFDKKYRSMIRSFSKNDALSRILFGVQKTNYANTRDKIKEMFGVKHFFLTSVFGEKQIESLWQSKLTTIKIYEHIAQVTDPNQSMLLKKLVGVLSKDEYSQIARLISGTYSDFVQNRDVIEKAIYSNLQDEDLYIALIELVVLKIAFILEGIYVINVVRFDFATLPEQTVLLSVWNNVAFEDLLASRLLLIVNELHEQFENRKTELKNSTEVIETKSYFELFTQLFGDFFSKGNFSEESVKVAFNGLAEPVTIVHQKLEEFFDFFAHISDIDVSQYGTFEPLLKEYPTVEELTSDTNSDTWAMASRKIVAATPVVGEQNAKVKEERNRLNNLGLIELYKEIDALFLSPYGKEARDHVKTEPVRTSHQYFMIACCRQKPSMGKTYDEANMSSRPLNQFEFRHMLGTFQNLSSEDWKELLDGFKANGSKFPGPKNKRILLENLKLIAAKSPVFRKITDAKGLFDFWFPFSVERKVPPPPTFSAPTFTMIDRIEYAKTEDMQFRPFVINVNYQLPEELSQLNSNFQTSILTE